MSLGRKLEKIKKVFDIAKVQSIETNQEAIKKYYRINSLTYSFFHDTSFIHMGITRAGNFKKEDLLEPVKFIEKSMLDVNAQKVLELAAGRGGNSLYLSQKNPELEFHALDLPDGQFDNVLKKKCLNFFPQFGDYHDLSKFEPNSFDLVFIIESLCYSNQKEKVLTEVNRILKPKGLLIIIDGYLKKKKDKLSTDEILAMDLAQKGMLVEEFENYEKFKSKIPKTGFKIIYEEDVSSLVIPTLKSFEKKAKVFFGLPTKLSRLLVSIFPHQFMNNILSGYLLFDLVESGVGNYTILVLEKK